MDKKEKFSIVEVKQYYHNLKTELFLEYDAPEEAKFKFLQDIINKLIGVPGVYGKIKYIDKTFDKENLKKVKQKWNWIFYQDENNNLYLNIYFFDGKHYNENFHQFWFKCNCSEEEAKNYLIYPLINFELRYFLYFEDGGSVFLNTKDDLKIEMKIKKESPQTEFFNKNCIEKELKELIF